MLHDLDMTLNNMLGDAKAPAELRDAQASFLTPERGAALSENTVNLFLYDVKENRELRDPVPIVERVNADFVRRRPLLRVDCSYLVTAWSTKEKDVKVKEEHQLLGQALLWLSRFPTIPEKFLQGTLANQPFPPPTMVAQMDGTHNTAEFWTALGIPPRPCFNLLVTIAMDLGVKEKEGPPVASKEIRLKQINPPGEAESLFEIGGVLRRADTGEAIAGGLVSVIQTNARATTDEDGRFRLQVHGRGSFTLRIVAHGYASRETDISVPATRPNAYDVSLTP